MATAYLALGANLGDRLANLRAAAAALAGEVRVEARSSVYESAAIADEPQPPYLNAVVRVATELSPRALLGRGLGVEAALGRVRPDRRWAPRPIDVDLLLYDDLVVGEAGLVVPHPRLLERSFVRVPLAEVAAPGLRHPITGAPLDQAPAATDLRRLGDPL